MVNGNSSSSTISASKSTFSAKSSAVPLQPTAVTLHSASNAHKGASTPTSSASATKSSPTGSKGTGTHHGLSTGASIGIGVAIAIVGILVIGAVAFIIFWRHRSKKRKSRAADARDSMQRFEDAQPVPSIHEKDSKVVEGELATKANTHEMQVPPSEMPADSVTDAPRVANDS